MALRPRLARVFFARYAVDCFTLGGSGRYRPRWPAPKEGETEDTGFTGSAHCSLVPSWAKRLRKKHSSTKQLSPRRTTIDRKLPDDRVFFLSSAFTYMEKTGPVCPGYFPLSNSLRLSRAG